MQIFTDYFVLLGTKNEKGGLVNIRLHANATKPPMSEGL